MWLFTISLTSRSARWARSTAKSPLRHHEELPADSARVPTRQSRIRLRRLHRSAKASGHIGVNAPPAPGGGSLHAPAPYILIFVGACGDKIRGSLFPHSQRGCRPPAK